MDINTERGKYVPGLIERASRAVDIPPDIAAGTPTLTLSGCGELHMEGHQGIIEYGSERININCGKYIISLSGAELELRAMNSDELIITGTFFSLEYIY